MKKFMEWLKRMFDAHPWLRKLDGWKRTLSGILGGVAGVLGSLAGAFPMITPLLGHVNQYLDKIAAVGFTLSTVLWGLLLVWGWAHAEVKKMEKAEAKTEEAVNG